MERGILNEELLDQAEADPSITVFFEHKLSTADFDQSSAVFQCKDHTGRVSNVTVAFDLCIGADGSYSNVRRQMMRVARSAFLIWETYAFNHEIGWTINKNTSHTSISSSGCLPALSYMVPRRF